jgi:hypothetical protein
VRRSRPLLFVSAALFFACSKRDASNAARPDAQVPPPFALEKEESPQEQAARAESQKKARAERARTRAAALGLELANDGTLHRPARATCDATIAGPPCGAHASGSCATAAGCKDGPRGACVARPTPGIVGQAAALRGAMLAVLGGADAGALAALPDAAASPDEASWCACEYACASDSDCKKDEACLCGDGERHSLCVKALCKTDRDCKGGGCDLAEWSNGCGTERVLACRTPLDTCTSSSDCREGSCGYAHGRFECVRRSCIE